MNGSWQHLKSVATFFHWFLWPSQAFNFILTYGQSKLHVLFYQTLYWKRRRQKLLSFLSLFWRCD
ncbi:hypothetical protein Plhal304r1_c076g0163171 [Plasmopara halstedii]